MIYALSSSACARSCLLSSSSAPLFICSRGSFVGSGPEQRPSKEIRNRGKRPREKKTRRKENDHVLSTRAHTQREKWRRHQALNSHLQTSENDRERKVRYAKSTLCGITSNLPAAYLSICELCSIVAALRMRISYPISGCRVSSFSLSFLAACSTLCPARFRLRCHLIRLSVSLPPSPRLAGRALPAQRPFQSIDAVWIVSVLFRRPD